jgi:hypothetical protein
MTSLPITEGSGDDSELDDAADADADIMYLDRGYDPIYDFCDRF